MSWPVWALLSLTLGCTLNIQAASSSSDQPQKRVLVFYAARRDSPSPVVAERIYQKALTAGLSERLDYYSEFIDVGRFADPDYQTALHEFLSTKYKRLKIDLIISTSDTANDFVTRHRSDLFPEAGVVFVYSSSYRPGPNSTGVVLPLDFKGTLDLALRLQPDTRKVFVVSGSSEFDKWYETVARQQLEPFASRVEFIYLVGLPMADLLKALANLPPRSLIYPLMITEDRTGSRFLPIDSLDRISAVANAPIYSWHELTMDHGIVGGSLQSSEFVATRTAELALRVLHGESPGSIPITEIYPNVIQVDWRQLLRWGISEDRLPTGTIVRFREPTFWQQYKWWIIAVISFCVLQSLLIIYLLLNREQRRRAERERERFASLAETEHRRLDEVVSNVPGIVWESRLAPDGTTRQDHFVSQYVEKMLGYTVGEWMSDSRFWLSIVPEDERQEVLDRNDAIFESGQDGVVQFRWRTKDSRLLWVEAHLSVIFDDHHRPIGLRGVTLDITDRKTAEWSLRASEERNRAILSAIPDLMFLQTSDGVYLDFHAKEPNTLLVSPADFMGHNMRDVLPPKLADDFLKCFQRAKETREPQTMEYLLPIQSEEMWFEARIVATDGDEFLSVVRDVTERKNADRALRSALSEVGQLKDQLHQENLYLQDEIRLEHDFQEIVGQSDALKYVLFKIEQVAPTDATVLILGETGTGKELVARAIHGAGKRKDRPMVKINCATLPASLIESELFGHEKGAFTGAQARKIGRFEVADGATLFLDEIGELPLELQSKLLRVLQEGEFERLGSSQTRKVDVRIIAATNRNLKVEVKDGLFREDLWYRLNVFPITVPPLRQRKGDIPELIAFFVNRFNRKLGRIVKTISPQTQQVLQDYAWPGNVRELANVVERAVINSHSTVLRLAEKLETEAKPVASEEMQVKRATTLQDVERDHIIAMLDICDWRIEGPGGAAEILGINSSTLRSRMSKLGIKRPGKTPPFVAAATRI